MRARKRTRAYDARVMRATLFISVRIFSCVKTRKHFLNARGRGFQDSLMVPKQDFVLRRGKPRFCAADRQTACTHDPWKKKWISSKKMCGFAYKPRIFERCAFAKKLYNFVGREKR